jgi:hypothetical protein
MFKSVTVSQVLTAGSFNGFIVTASIKIDDMLILDTGKITELEVIAITEDEANT